MKEILRELDESRLARDEVISLSKDNEKKVQILEAEVLQYTEVRVINWNPTEICKYNALSGFNTLSAFMCACRSSL